MTTTENTELENQAVLGTTHDTIASSNMQTTYDLIPHDMRSLKQWAGTTLTRDGKYKIAAKYLSPHEPPLYLAVNDTKEWMSFDEAVLMCETYNCPLTFLLTKDDEFTCIDIDIKEDSPPEYISNAQWLIDTFASYTEVSSSGLGYHIWVKSDIDPVRKRIGNGLEIYHSGRHIVFTGNSFYKEYTPANYADSTIRAMFPQAYMPNEVIDIPDEPEIVSDKEIMKLMTKNNKSNERYVRLLEISALEKYPIIDKITGVMIYESQSSADLAMINFLCMETNNNSQVKRIFKTFGLGKRKKADDRYLNMTIRTSRNSIHYERQLSAGVDDFLTRVCGYTVTGSEDEAIATEQLALPIMKPNYGDKPENPLLDFGIDEEYSLPPGNTGKFAQWIFDNSKKPYIESAIVASIVMYAGIVGNSYYINETGLNVMLILVGASGKGKESLMSSIGSLETQLYGDHGAKHISEFILDVEDMSASSMHKNIVECPNHSCVHIFKEWGQTIRRMGEGKMADQSANGIKTLMTKLFDASSKGSFLQGKSYSKANSMNDIATILTGFGYSFVGDTVPEIFLEALTERMMSDGFLSRFTIVTIPNGATVKLRKGSTTKISKDIKENLINLIDYCRDEMNYTIKTNILETPEAESLFDQYEEACRLAADLYERQPAYRQLYTRAHLKAWRIAGVLAVADNHLEPIITITHAQWAMKLINKDIANMWLNINEGNVGTATDTAKRSALKLVINELMNGGYPANVKEFKKHLHLLKHGIIHRSVITYKTQNMRVFNHQGKASSELTDTLIDLQRDGTCIKLSDLQKRDAGITTGGEFYRFPLHS
jgi:hypothetical protein